MYENPANAINLCACIGPVYGEPMCPCAMQRAGLESSQEHKDANAAATKRLNELFGENGEFFNQAVGTKPLIQEQL